MVFGKALQNLNVPQSELRLVLIVFDGSPCNIGSGKSLAKSGMSFIIFILPSLFLFKKKEKRKQGDLKQYRTGRWSRKSCDVTSLIMWVSTLILGQKWFYDNRDRVKVILTPLSWSSILHIRHCAITFVSLPSPPPPPPLPSEICF